MIWAIGAAFYAVAYAVAVTLTAGDPVARTWVGDIGLALSPLLPIAVILRRRADWNDRAQMYWGAVAVGCALWFVGHIGWSVDELLLGRPLPWLEWPVAVKLTGGIIPIAALVAWPHAQIRGGSIPIIALDIGALTFVNLFLFWSLVMAPGLVPAGQPIGITALRALGLVLHVVIVGSFGYAAYAAGIGPWRTVYRRLAIGAGLGSVALMWNASAMVLNTYRTGSVGDTGWILPFWFYAWAASEAPDSPARSAAPIGGWTAPSHVSPPLLPVAIVPIVGYMPRFLFPLGMPIDLYRELGTLVALCGALGLTMMRVVMEQRARHRADYREWLLATACEQSHDLLLIARLSRIDYANDAFRRALGYSLEELRELQPGQLVAPEAKEMLADVRDRLRRNEVVQTRTVLQRRDRSLFHADCTITPLQTASGSSHFVVVVRDLTDDLRLRDHLVRSERMSAVGSLVSGVAHELNNPLQAVFGVTDLLLRRPLDGPARADVEQIRAEADRAGRIVRNLLVFAQKSQPNRLPTDVNDIVAAAVAMRYEALSHRRIQLYEQYAPELPRVPAHRPELQEAVLALLYNAEYAIAHAHPNGVIIIRTYAALSGAEVVIEIADDGPGVPAELASRIFEPFFTTRPVGEGSGLGLSIAFGVATAHGGSLELAPSDRGACFR